MSTFVYVQRCSAQILGACVAWDNQPPSPYNSNCYGRVNSCYTGWINYYGTTGNQYRSTTNDYWDGTLVGHGFSNVLNV